MTLLAHLLKGVTVLVIAIAVGLTARVALEYLQVGKLSSKRQERRRFILPPKYIFSLTLSHIMIGVEVLLQNVVHFEEPLTMYVPYNLAAFSLSCWGMYQLLKQSRCQAKELVQLDERKEDDERMAPTRRRARQRSARIRRS